MNLGLFSRRVSLLLMMSSLAIIPAPELHGSDAVEGVVIAAGVCFAPTIISVAFSIALIRQGMNPNDTITTKSCLTLISYLYKTYGPAEAFNHASGMSMSSSDVATANKSLADIVSKINTDPKGVEAGLTDFYTNLVAARKNPLGFQGFMDAFKTSSIYTNLSVDDTAILDSALANTILNLSTTPTMGGSGIADPAVLFTSQINDLPTGSISAGSLVGIAEDVGMSQTQLINVVRNSQKLTDSLNLAEGQTVEGVISNIAEPRDLPPPINLLSIQSLYVIDTNNIITNIASGAKLTLSDLSTLRDFVNAGGSLKNGMGVLEDALKAVRNNPDFTDYGEFIDNLIHAA